MQITWVPIPQENYSTNHGGNQLKKIVLHWIVGEIEACDATFKNPARRASAHYAIGSNGEVHQYVDDRNIAWHAGPGVNFESIGIEHAGGQLINGVRKTPTQLCHDTSAELVASLCRKYAIPCDREHIRKHSDYMSTQCPGTLNVDYIINRAILIIKGQLMAFDYELKKVGADIHLIMNQPATGPFVVRDKITNEVTDSGNILNGTDKIVSPNCTKRLYEVSFNGVTKTLDLRDPVPLPEDPNLVRIRELEQLLVNSQMKEAAERTRAEGLLVKLAELDEQILQIQGSYEAELLDKDVTIRQLREVAGVGVLERFLKALVRVFNRVG